LFAYYLSQCSLHTTCLEIGPELPVLETRHGTLCYSITFTDHGGVGWSMKADNGGRKGDELATALYPIRSRAIISGTFPKVPSFSADVYATISESAVINHQSINLLATTR
jgi:hypothetical protein